MEAFTCHNGRDAGLFVCCREPTLAILREGCQSPSPEVVCILYRYRANDSQGLCTVCTFSLVVAPRLVGNGDIFMVGLIRR